MYIVVCYDISDNRQRTRLHRLLLAYGTPVQRSVFECHLTRRQFHRLRRQARRWVKRSTDSVRYYQMCRQCQGRTRADGTPLVETGHQDDFVV